MSASCLGAFITNLKNFSGFTCAEYRLYIELFAFLWNTVRSPLGNTITLPVPNIPWGAAPEGALFLMSNILWTACYLPVLSLHCTSCSPYLKFTSKLELINFFLKPAPSWFHVSVTYFPSYPGLKLHRYLWCFLFLVLYWSTNPDHSHFIISSMIIIFIPYLCHYSNSCLITSWRDHCNGLLAPSFRLTLLQHILGSGQIIHPQTPL